MVLVLLLCSGISWILFELLGWRELNVSGFGMVWNYRKSNMGLVRVLRLRERYLAFAGVRP